MAAFDYIALDGKGKQKKGVMEGDSQRQVRQTLRDQGLIPLSVEPVSQSSRNSGQNALPLIGGWGTGPSIGVRDLSLITRQMATLIQAGLPLEEVLKAVSEQTEKTKIKSILMAVRSKVLEGYSLAESFGEFPRAFPKLYRSTVSAGEHSGNLDIVMNRLADYTERAHETSRDIISALVYPVVLLVVSISIVIFLMTSVVPGVIDIFSDNKQQLPMITRALIAVSDFFSKYTLVFIAALVFIYMGVSYLLKDPAIRLKFDKKILDLPVIGKLVCNINTARFASTLSILTSSGVTLVDAMRIAGEVLSNEWLRQRVVIATRSVSEGASLKGALDSAGYFPPMMLHMIASGEASGELDTMLERTARAQEMDLENFVSVVVSLVPTLVILLMGGVVLAIVLAILLPIFQLNQMVG